MTNSTPPLSIYPVGGYICKAISGMLLGEDPLHIFIVRDLVMASFKGPRVINPKYFGRDRGVAENVVVDAIDTAERQGVLKVEYSENAKGYPQMEVSPTEKAIKALKEHKAEAQSFFHK